MSNVGGLLLAGSLLVPTVGVAQTVIGTVAEEDTGSRIAGAVVELIPTDGSPAVEVETDSVGMFLAHARGAGRFMMRVSHPEYATTDAVELTVGVDETLDVEVWMGREVVPLEPLTVRARRSGRLSGYYERLERPGFARFITRSEIARRPGARATDLLRDVPGVYIRRVRTTTGTGDNLITMRLGQCTPVIYIDGVQVRQSLGGGLDGLLRPEMIEGVEVYRGSAGVPPQFAADGCGVVAFWTRTGEDDAVERWGWKKVLAGAAALAVLGVLIAGTR